MHKPICLQGKRQVLESAQKQVHTDDHVASVMPLRPKIPQLWSRAETIEQQRVVIRSGYFCISSTNFSFCPNKKDLGMIRDHLKSTVTPTEWKWTAYTALRGLIEEQNKDINKCCWLVPRLSQPCCGHFRLIFSTFPVHDEYYSQVTEIRDTGNLSRLEYSQTNVFHDEN